MQLRADNLAKSLLLPSMAKGNIKIFPGDESLFIGQAANGGVITKIKHNYVPFFTTTFWLEGSPDIDNPEQEHFRRKIGEHEGLTQTNSASILETGRRTDGASRVRGTAGKTAPHNHADDESGGSVMGDIAVAGIEIIGTLPDGSPNMKATRGGLTGVCDWKWITGLGRLISGDLMLKVTGISGTLVEGVIFDLPIETTPAVKGVTVLVNGSESDPDTVARFITVGGRYPLVFIETPGNDPPKAAIVAYSTDFIVDHGADDEDGSNTSTVVNGIEKPGEAVAGDTDDLTIVAKRREDTGGGSVALLEPRWMLYMAEREFDDTRRVLIQGPHEKSADRFARKQGQLADVMRYSRTDKTHAVGRLVQRTDANIAATRPADLRKDEEGPLDYDNLSPRYDESIQRPSEGMRGCAVMFDRFDWSSEHLGDETTTPAEKKRGLRYKVLPIIDHRTRNTGAVPTGGDLVNESTQVLGYDSKSDGVSLADLDDILIVDNAALMLYMESHHKEIGGADPHSVQFDFEVATGKAQRFGYISDGATRAFLSDVFDYNDHSKEETQLAVLLSKAMFKHTTAGGAPAISGGMDVQGLTSLKPVFTDRPDRLFGRLALDDTRPDTIKDSKGLWVIEIPFNICKLGTATAALGLLKSNDDKLLAEIESVVDDINSAFETLVETNDDSLLANIESVRELLHDIASELYDNDMMLGAFIEFQDKAIIEEMKALATCVTMGFMALASTISTCSSCHAASPVCPPPSFEPSEPAGLHTFEGFPVDLELEFETPELDDPEVELSSPCT